MMRGRHARHPGGFTLLELLVAMAIFAILGTLALFLCLSVAAALGRPAWPGAEDAVAVFRLGVALTVLPFGWLAPLTGPAGPTGRLPFPLHIQALLGTLWVVWLFRLVGLWWLVAALLHLSRRLA